MVERPMKKLFVEGGGDNDALKTECRRGFNKLLEKAGFKGRMPRIVACGGRNSAHDQFCTMMRYANSEDVAILLVDAEAPVTLGSPWDHVKARPGDGWQMPETADDDHLHFMVECMESWFFADKDVLSSFFGDGFKESALPDNPKVEEISKSDVYEKLERATSKTKKGRYGKGSHSFKILAEIDPKKLRNAAPFADRFFKRLEKVL